MWIYVVGLVGQMLSGVATMIAVRRWLMIIKDRLTNSMRGSPNLSFVCESVYCSYGIIASMSANLSTPCFRGLSSTCFMKKLMSASIVTFILLVVSLVGSI